MDSPFPTPGQHASLPHTVQVVPSPIIYSKLGCIYVFMSKCIARCFFKCIILSKSNRYWQKGNVFDRSLSSYVKRQPGMLTASRQRLLFIIPLDMKRSCTLARPRRPSSLAGAKKGRSCSFHSHLCLQVISDDLPPSSSLKSSSPPS